MTKPEFLKGLKVYWSSGGATTDAETIEDLIRKVDARLYRAKSEGRNRVCTADT